MEDVFVLEKWEWTDEDFNEMGWHDCPIYALRFDDDIYFDIDYVFKWINNGAGMSFTFWMAPVTLIFENPTYMKINAELDFINGLEMADILKESDEDGNKVWRIALQEGDIIIKAETFKQIIRRPPSLQFGLAIAPDERGGISFNTISDVDYQPTDDIVKRKINNSLLFNLEKERCSLERQRDRLDQSLISTKDYILEKQRIEKRLLEIDLLLKCNK